MAEDWTIRRKPNGNLAFGDPQRLYAEYPIVELNTVDLAADWVVGFVDGEGCFHVSVNKHPDMSMGYQVLPEFVITQHERDRQILLALKRFFGAGVVRSNYDDRQCLRIRKLDVLRRVCVFFQEHPLKTKKNIDFLKFRQVIRLMSQRRHLCRNGLIEIVDVALTMNSAVRPALMVVRSELMAHG